MIYYNKYLEALNETFSLQKKQYTQRRAELKNEYKKAENRIRGRFQQKMDKARSEYKKSLEEIDKEASTLMGNNSSTSLDQGQSLMDTRDSLKQQYDELSRLSSEKKLKRKEVRGKLFRFWWKS